MQVLIVADDLTGALDSAVTLAAVGLSCRVARGPVNVKEALADRPDVLAVSTASREVGEGEAADAVDCALEASSPLRSTIFFKKVDSRLKGNVRAELAAMAQRTGLSRALIAPAIPQQGRIVEGGLLRGIGLGAPVDIAGMLAGSGLDLLVPDAQTDADLDRSLETVLKGPPTLLVGAAGLAAALARRLRPGVARKEVGTLPGPLMIAVGSRDPITIAQIEALRAGASIPILAAPGGELAPGTAVPGTRSLLIQLAPSAMEIGSGFASVQFARTIGYILKSASFGTLFGCGGETVDAILGEIGVGHVKVEGELLPGVPVSSIAVNGKPVQLVTKSGGFGPPETLLSAVEKVHQGIQDSMR